MNSIFYIFLAVVPEVDPKRKKKRKRAIYLLQIVREPYHLQQMTKLCSRVDWVVGGAAE